MVDAFSFPSEKYLLIGKIVKVHGLKGEVKIFPFSRQPENIKAYKQLTLVTTEGQLSSLLNLVSCRVQKNLAVVGFEGIASRSQSEKLIGMGVLLEKNNLPAAREHEYYWQDFLHQDVYLLQGEKVGRVENMFSNGVQDILVVQGGDGEHLIPVTKDIVVQHTAEGLVINPPPGLLQLNSGVDD